MLEVFKSRPHIPSVEIIDLVKKKSSVIISKHIACNIKYAAHKTLHGSMNQHYNKVMDYHERVSNPQSHFTVVVIDSKFLILIF